MSLSLNDDRPTLLMLGQGDPMQGALQTALNRYATFVEVAEASSVVATVMAAAPDVVILVGDAAGARADSILHDLHANTMTATVPVVLLAAEAGLERRLEAFRSGAVAVVPRTASIDQMARDISRLARELPERSGDRAGEVGEATVDELLGILSKELKSGILSVSQSGRGGDGRSARFVLRSGRPVQEAIADFVQRIRPLVEDAKPLSFEFLEAPQGRFQVLDQDSEQGDRSLFKGRRILLIENNPATADALAQELRAHDATVVVTDGQGAGFERAKSLDPEVVLIAEAGLEGWGYEVMSRLRRDTQLRWASVLVIHSEQLFEQGQAPRMDRLAGSLQPLLSPDRELAERAANEDAFDTRLEVIGPTRLLRALLAAERTLHLTVRNSRAVVEVDIAEGLLAGATAQATSEGAQPLGGPAALAMLMSLASGRVSIERRERPAAANLLSPIDDALVAAGLETSPLRASLLPEAKASAPGGATAVEAFVPSDPQSAGLVTELRQLVSQLKASMPPDRALAEPPVATPPSRKRPAHKQTLVGMVSPAATGGFVASPPPAPGIAAPAAPPPPAARIPAPVAAPPRSAKAASMKAKRARNKTLVGIAAPSIGLRAPSGEGGAPGAPEKPNGPSREELATSVQGVPRVPVPVPAAPELDAEEATSIYTVDEFVGAEIPVIAEPAPIAFDDTEPPAPQLSPPALDVPPPPRMPAEAIAATQEMQASPPQAPPAQVAQPSPVAPVSQAEMAAVGAKRSNRLLTVVALVLLGAIALTGVALTFGVPDELAFFRADATPTGEPSRADESPALAPPPVAPEEDTPPEEPAEEVVIVAAVDAGSELTDAGAEEDAGAEVEYIADAGAQAAEGEEVVDAGSLADAGEADAGAEAVAEVVEGDQADVPSTRRTYRRPVDRVIDQANTLRRAGNMRAAEAKYRQALSMQPNSGRAMAGLTRTLLARRQNREAVQWARKLARSRPNQSSNFVLLGDAFLRSGNRTGARNAYRRALSVNSRNRAARRKLNAL